MKTTSPKCGRRGNVAIEFALVVPLILALTTAIIDYGWYLSRASRVVVATRDAARLGVTYASDPSSTPDVVAEQRARAALQGAGIDCGADCTIVATIGAVDGVPSLSVVVAAPFTPLTGLVPVPDHMKVGLTMALELRDY